MIKGNKVCLLSFLFKDIIGDYKIIPIMGKFMCFYSTHSSWFIYMVFRAVDHLWSRGDNAGYGLDFAMERF